MASKRTLSPLWGRALERYRDELEEVEDFQSIQDIQSLQDLVNSFDTIQNIAPRSQPGIVSINRLAPKLKFVDDFSAVLALCFGADATLTAAVWGSIRLILSHASSAADTFQDVLDMLEELSLTLPRFQIYENTLPLNRSFQTSLVDVYTEVICFYARAIHFLRSNPHVILRKNEWQSFKNDFSRTIMRIKRMSSAVESEADMARMRKDEQRYQEVLELMSAMKMGRSDDRKSVQYNNIPHPMNSKFSGRNDVLDKIQHALDPEDTASLLKSVSLFGLGGVGKTQIAVQFAYQHLSNFDVIIWVAADNSLSIGQSFRTVAEGLRLFGKDDDTKDAAAAVWKVKNWLNSTKSSWLVVFDNADDPVAMRTAWPGTVHGSVLVTTRNFAVATSLAAQCVQVEALSEEAGSLMLLKAAGIEGFTPGDVESAIAISGALGGLPLALTQIGGFIAQRKMRLNDFLPLYERNRAKIDARKPVGGDAEHTLTTVWDVSFGKLTENSTSLLGVLALFDPDNIAEEIFLEGALGLEDRLSFLSDEMDLGDAVEELLRVALVNRSAEAGSLSIHRLVQTAAIRKTKEKDRTSLFDAVVHILSWGFPDHASEDIGHQISSWSRCEKCVPHINNLALVAKQHSLKPGNQEKYADLLLRCSWYLYEREMYVIARSMVDQAISTFADTTSLEYASAIDLGGLLDLDLARPSQALEPFQCALEIRKTRLGLEDPFIAYSLNNIALAYTEMGELDLAYAAHEEAIALRLKANSDRIGNSYSNMSSLLLRMGRPDDAEEMLARCPSLKDFTDETFLSTGNPRFSGDMVLLSRIRLAQGRTTDALRLASKALAFRQKLLGNRLKTCDSLYDVATMLLKENHVGPAMDLLEELVSIAETFVEGDGQRARALFKLSYIHEVKGRSTDSQHCRQMALELRARAAPELKDAPFEESEFSRLCLWMLW